MRMVAIVMGSIKFPGGVSLMIVESIGVIFVPLSVIVFIRAA